MLHLPEDKHLILFGALNVTDTRKGVDYLIKALRLLSRNDMELVVFGQVKREIKDLVPVPIHSLGYLSDDNQIVALYNAVDLFVTSSLDENLPNTIMEAMACGTPCVGFQTGGIPEMIDHLKNGYVARYQDAEDLAQFSDRPYDLIATASTVQWFDHLPIFIKSLPELLSETGVIALSTFGPDNFIEIRTTTGDGLDYYTADELSKLFQQAGLTILECKEYIRQLNFDSPTAVLRHIKATGVNAIHKSRWTPRRLTQFETDYRTQYSTSTGEVTITYHPILIVAQKS